MTAVTHPRRRAPAGPVAVGALLGLTWAASFRGWMMHLAGTESTYTWIGTFACLLLPGALAGALLPATLFSTLYTTLALVCAIALRRKQTERNPL